MKRTAVLLLLLVGCQSIERQAITEKQGSSTQVKKDRALAEKATLASILKSNTYKRTDYKISPADLLIITVYREKELTRTARVSQKGTISFPLVGNIKVGDKSTADAERELSLKLADFLVSPQVTIFIKEYGNKQIYVLGEVEKPGAYELPTETKLTVLEAISKAGGFSAVASRDRTKVIRTTDKGENQSFIIEVSAITKNGQKQKDIALEPNDVIYIPQSFF